MNICGLWIKKQNNSYLTQYFMMTTVNWRLSISSLNMKLNIAPNMNLYTLVNKSYEVDVFKLNVVHKSNEPRIIFFVPVRWTLGSESKRILIIPSCGSQHVSLVTGLQLDSGMQAITCIKEAVTTMHFPWSQSVVCYHMQMHLLFTVIFKKSFVSN